MVIVCALKIETQLSCDNHQAPFKNVIQTGTADATTKTERDKFSKSIKKVAYVKWKHILQ